MAMAISSRLLASVTLALLIISCFGSLKIVSAQQRTWCVAKSTTSNQVLLDNIRFACARVNCAVIGPGGACFFPNTLPNHASVAMNLYYQANNRNPAACDFNGSGDIAITDPSYGTCKYS